MAGSIARALVRVQMDTRDLRRGLDKAYRKVETSTDKMAREFKKGGKSQA